MRALLFCALLALLGVSVAAARPALQPIQTDRWIEMDLYWFEPADPTRSADTFWRRYAPLYRGTSGYRGVVLSVGLTANYILEFSGDLDQAIVLPRTNGQELGHRIAGQLQGDTAQRQLSWRRRFAEQPVGEHSVAYAHWTYRDLRRLTDALRARARREGIPDFRVASFAVGSDGAYGDPMPFARRHPEAFTPWTDHAPGTLASSSHLDPANLLHADPAVRAAFPLGIREGVPLHALLSAQWAELARAVHLDGLMLRDSLSFPRAYTRYGPTGPYLTGPDVAERTTGGLSALLGGIKRLSPRSLTMMYSTGATAGADWRANGVDLERLAREGNLDIFVDQTRAGAWGEVGVRQQTFWNAPLLGWSYQLAYLLDHAAVLAGSRVRHYPLVETFDAWESWDTIHTAPERLRWAIWAYGHAGVKMPRGLHMPSGSYISWGHHGRDLLDPADVAFLTRELDGSERDAAGTEDIVGPTMVYSRESASAGLAPPQGGLDPRDRLDEQVGSIVLWPLPILSATRSEWLPAVRSDLLLFGSTRGLDPGQMATISARAARGQPMAFFGAVGIATSPELLRLLGIEATAHVPRVNDRSLVSVPGPAWPREIMVPRGLEAPPPQLRIAAVPTNVVHSSAVGAGLVLDMRGGRNLSTWDPVPLSDFWYRPLRDLMNGDPAAFAVVSATLNSQLARTGALSADSISAEGPGTIAAWVRGDGSIRILASDLAEGLDDSAVRSRSIRLIVPVGWQGCRWRTRWGGAEVQSAGRKLEIALPARGSELLECAPGER